MSGPARFLWICAAVALVCFVALAVMSSAVLQSEGLLVFDSRVLGYSAAEARLYLDWITRMPEARATYLGVFRQLDTVFPVLLTVCAAGAMWLNSQGSHPIRRVAILGAPLAYLLMDLLENARVGQMLRDGVGVADQVIRQASDFTTLKWTFLAVTALLVLVAWWSQRARAGI